MVTSFLHTNFPMLFTNVLKLQSSCLLSKAGRIPLCSALQTRGAQETMVTKIIQATFLLLDHSNKCLCFWSTEILLACSTYLLGTTKLPFFGPHTFTHSYTLFTLVLKQSLLATASALNELELVSSTCAPAQFQVHIIVLLCMHVQNNTNSLSESQRNDAPHDV